MALSYNIALKLSDFRWQQLVNISSNFILYILSGARAYKESFTLEKERKIDKWNGL